MKRIVRQVIFYSVLLGLWFLLAKLRIWPPYVFPTPWGVAESLGAGFQDHSFWIAIGVSMKRMLLGYGISVMLGMVLGLAVASNKFLEDTMGALLASMVGIVLAIGLQMLAPEKAYLYIINAALVGGMIAWLVSLLALGEGERAGAPAGVAGTVVLERRPPTRSLISKRATLARGRARFRRHAA